MKTRVALRLVAVVLTASFVGMGCEPAQDPTATRSTSSGAAERRSRAARSTAPETVDLASLLRELPEYGGSGRNLFAFGSRPVVAPPPGEIEQPPPPPPPVTTPTTPVARTAPVDIKFAGYVETKTVEGGTKKYAVFLDGTEILTGAEGDLVANRYKIVQIGLESVTVGVVGSNNTQQIPLRSN